MNKDKERDPSHTRYRKQPDQFSDRLNWINSIGATCNLPKLTYRKLKGSVKLTRYVFCFEREG